MAMPYAAFHNPQSLNLFIYALNNPLNKFDLDSHDWRDYVQQPQKWITDHPRTVNAAKAVLAASVTVATVATVVATAPVSVPTTLVGAAIFGLSTAAATVAVTGGTVATVLYAGAAITGNQDMSQAAGTVQTVTNPAGYAGTVLSGGNKDIGGIVASISDLVSGDPVAGTAGAADLTGYFLKVVSSQGGQDQMNDQMNNNAPTDSEREYGPDSDHQDEEYVTNPN